MSYIQILDTIDGINTYPTKPKLRRQFACIDSFKNIYDLQCKSNADFKQIVDSIKNNTILPNNTPSSFIKKHAFKAGYIGTPNLSYIDWKEEIINSSQHTPISTCRLCTYLSLLK
jgi:hypothetical protein